MLFPSGEVSSSLAHWLKSLVPRTGLWSYCKTDYSAHWQGQEY